MTSTVPPEAVCFDLDGTLLDGSGLQRSIVGACTQIARRRPRLTGDGLVAANTAVWQDYWAEVELDWETGALDGVSLSREAWRRTLLACGSTDESLVQYATEIHARLAHDAHRLFDDAREAVDTVRRRHLPIALITNGAADTQRQKIDAVGIEHWFDVIIVSGEIGVAKPDVEPFQAALAAIDVSNGWHVGDSLASDVAGANAAGLTSVWLNRHGLARPPADALPDFEVRTLWRFIELLDERIS